MNLISETLPLPEALIEQLKQTEQNPRYHAEGNVYQHTLLVLETYQKLHDEFELSEADHEVLYWACVLHDLGKIPTTQWHRNRWRSKGHERAGIPMARNILLERPEIGQEQRRKILDLVRFHSIPLQWGLHQKPLAAYKRLATQTDLRLLGIFAYFDVVGRVCEESEKVRQICRDFNQDIVPRIHYEMGAFEDNLAAYRSTGLRHQNALWHALGMEDIRLLEKLLQARPDRSDKASSELVMTIAAPGSAKNRYLDQHYGHYARFNLDQIDLGFNFQTPHQRESQLRQVKHFISVYAQAGRNMLINGHFLQEETRLYLAAFARQHQVRIKYLFFEEKLSHLLKDIPEHLSQTQIEAGYKQLLTPHPWEGHAWETVDIKQL